MTYKSNLGFTNVKNITIIINKIEIRNFIIIIKEKNELFLFKTKYIL